MDIGSWRTNISEWKDVGTLLISFVAVIVAICSLWLSYIQSNAIREHPKLSVKPVLTSYKNFNKDSDPISKYEVDLINAGLGPAFIRQAHYFRREGNKIKELENLLEFFTNTKEPTSNLSNISIQDKDNNTLYEINFTRTELEFSEIEPAIPVMSRDKLETICVQIKEDALGTMSLEEAQKDLHSKMLNLGMVFYYKSGYDEEFKYNYGEANILPEYKRD